jgi:hypothetical protein
MNEPSVEKVIEKGPMQGVGSGTLVMPPFQRGRTGRKGCTKYIQMQTGSWVTLNPDGSCHLGAWHKHLGDLRDVGREIEERKEYADAWRIHMKNAICERDEVLTALAALVAAEDASIDKFTACEIDGIEAAMRTARTILSQHNARHEP